MRVRTVLGLVLAMFLSATGCNSSPGGSESGSGASGAGAKASGTATAAASTSEGVPVVPAAALDVGLQPRNFDELQSLIASKKGKVVVVDVWSTNCPPCMEAFPGLVALHKKYGSEKLACISVCADYSGAGKPEDGVATPLKFLKEKGATFDNIFSTEADEALYGKLKIVSVPSILVYDTEGKLAKKWETETPYSTVEEVVKPLLK